MQDCSTIIRINKYRKIKASEPEHVKEDSHPLGNRDLVAIEDIIGHDVEPTFSFHPPVSLSHPAGTVYLAMSFKYL